MCAPSSRRSGATTTVGMVLINHGVFSFGDTARESYERMIELVTLAEEYLAESRRVGPARRSAPTTTARVVLARARATLRRDMSIVAGAPMIVTTTSTATHAGVPGPSRRAELASRGPMTPDHVIRTKRVPMIGRDVEAYAARLPRVLRPQRGRARAAAHDARPRAAGGARRRSSGC